MKKLILFSEILYLNVFARPKMKTTCCKCCYNREIDPQSVLDDYNNNSGNNNSNIDSNSTISDENSLISDINFKKTCNENLYSEENFLHEETIGNNCNNIEDNNENNIEDKKDNKDNNKEDNEGNIDLYNTISTEASSISDLNLKNNEDLYSNFQENVVKDNNNNNGNNIDDNENKDDKIINKLIDKINSIISSSYNIIRNIDRL